jgi:cytochrome d ubiquinol oxidase subunit I
MDVLTLSRLQFAAATLFHFLFVPLTLGLSVLTAVMETKFVRTGDPEYRRMARFWGKLFLINFAIGVVTGITLEFQFGTNWSRYSAYVGDVFGALLAIEATLAFFLESTFIAVWAFGWKRLSPKAHAAAIWLVALSSNVSAFWILTANAWMQHPVGYTLRNGRAEVTDFIAVVTQSFALQTFVHTVSAAYVLSGFFVLAVSAWHLLRGQNTAFFARSFRLAANFALGAALVVVLLGHLSGSEVAATQPAKLAAMEAHWETAASVPMYLLQWPDPSAERNAVQALPVPGLLSLLAFHDSGATVKGLREFPVSERPHVFLTWLSFKVMIGAGALILLVALAAWARRANPAASPGVLRAVIWALPLPWIAIEFGWMVTEVGRQPWIVYGVMKTADAVSRLATVQVATSLAAFLLVYGILGAVAISLLARSARTGPAAE